MDEDTINQVLRAKSGLSPVQIADLSLRMSLSNPKLKALVSLFANLDQITKITTYDKMEYSILEGNLELDKLIVTQSGTQVADSLGTENSIWSIIGVKLMYKDKKVISMEGANYTSGRPVVAPSTPSPLLAPSGSASSSSAASASSSSAASASGSSTSPVPKKPRPMIKPPATVENELILGGSRRRPYRLRRRRNKSYKKHSS